MLATTRARGVFKELVLPAFPLAPLPRVSRDGNGPRPRIHTPRPPTLLGTVRAQTLNRTPYYPGPAERGSDLGGEEMAVADIPASTPDDSGSDAYRRFVYQAEVAFRYCLDCATVGGVVSVTMEHLEDLAIEFSSGRWRLAQIKTRDPDQGAWTLPSLVSSGALDSLLRTHRALRGRNVEVEYEIIVEGAVKSGSPLADLLVNAGGADDTLIAEISRRLEIEEPECREFLEKLRIRERFPPREAIAASNIRKLGFAGRSVTLEAAADVYETVLERIKVAMEGRLLGNDWPIAVVEPESAEEADRLVMEGKKLTRTELAPLLEPLNLREAVFLAPILGGDQQITAMEEKLRAAGATDEIVRDARMLRAQASRISAELQSSSPYDLSEPLLDIRTRLSVVANAIAGVHLEDERPCLGIWNELQDRITSQAQSLDQQSLLRQDPMLLLGDVCQLTDDCEFWWGAPHAT